MSQLAELHSAEGARTTPDGMVLITYGDVPAEYRAGRESALLLDRTGDSAVRVAGSEAEAFLHRILASTVKGLEPGRTVRNLLLSAKGKILHSMELEREAEGFRLVTEAGRAGELIQALDMYLFSEDVQLSDESAQTAPLVLMGPAAGRLLAQLFGDDLPGPGEHRSASLAGHSIRLAQRPFAAMPAFWLDAGPRAAELWRALTAAGAVPGGVAALDSLRVEAGGALWGRDVDDNVYPQEARWDDAFSLEKGCYIGQEVVAKIDTYGGLNKLLMGLRLDNDDPVAPGTRLFKDDGGEWRDLGVVTTWAYSFALDGGMALGYIKRKHQELGTRFRVGDGPQTATLVEFPLGQPDAE